MQQTAFCRNCAHKQALLQCVLSQLYELRKSLETEMAQVTILQLSLEETRREFADFRASTLRKLEEEREKAAFPKTVSRLEESVIELKQELKEKTKSLHCLWKNYKCESDKVERLERLIEGEVPGSKEKTTRKWARGKGENCRTSRQNLHVSKVVL